MYIDLDKLSAIAQNAGKAILDIYHDESLFSQVVHKADNSPLTLADHASNNLIVEALIVNYPEIPVLSEEGSAVSFETRSKWDRFWLVDPLDGTKEFLKRNGEFTVNIALIDRGLPVLGIIYAPVWETLYAGDVHEKKAYKKHKNSIETLLSVNNAQSNRIAVGSRSHASEEETELLKTMDVAQTISVGSSLKFCMVAEGKADVYYRHGPTMEWDTAAGQAIVEAAGGSVMSIKTNMPLSYNKEVLTNEGFLVKGF